MHRSLHVLVVLPVVAALAAGCGARPPGAPTAVAAVAGAEAPVPTAVPGTAEAAYLDALAVRGLSGRDHAGTPEQGREICAALDGGQSVVAVAEALEASTSLVASDRGFVIGAATSAFCPQHREKR